MRITFSIEQTNDPAEWEEEGKNNLRYEINQRKELVDFGGDNIEVIMYTSMYLEYNKVMPVWTDSVKRIINALEKHYDYDFDFDKLVAALKEREEEKKNR